MYRLGPGNAGAGPGWEMVGSKLSKVLEEENQGATYTHPRSKSSDEQLMMGYVDDTSINISKNDNNLRDKMQRTIAKWQELLFATGETFEVFLLPHEVGGRRGKETETGMQLNGKIEIKQRKDQQRTKIEQKYLHDASIVLGIMCAPDLNCNAHA